MSTEMITTLQVRDDIDGTVLGPDEGYRVTFAVHGQDWQLDLNQQHYEEFMEKMDELTSRALRIGKQRKAEAVRRIGSQVDVVPIQEESRASAATKAALNNPRTQRPGIIGWCRINGWPDASGRPTIEQEEAWDEAHGVRNAA